MKNLFHLQTFCSKICKNSLIFTLIVTVHASFAPTLCARSKCPRMAERMTAEEYCAKYAEMARRQMTLYKVPASITLAQAILESDYGSSYLAVVANNHFGIKAFRADWTGEKVYCDDDNEDDPFCKFSTVADSYEYHSKFLQGQRYSVLFTYSIRDYESWAKGLQSCGYATSSSYASRLIDLIERYNLTAYDVESTQVITAQRTLYTTKAKGGLRYVRCLKGDDVAAIAKAYGIKESKIRYWNDLNQYSTLKENDIIYLENKKSKNKDFDTHTVLAGESLWSISQVYGVHIRSLMKRNKLVSATVHVGQVIRLH